MKHKYRKNQILSYIKYSRKELKGEFVLRKEYLKRLWLTLRGYKCDRVVHRSFEELMMSDIINNT